MAKPFVRINKNRWTLPPGQRFFLSILLLVLLAFYSIQSLSGFPPWKQKLSTHPTGPAPFVVEIEGKIPHPGIYAFPRPVGIDEVLLKAGIKSDLIRQATSPQPLLTGTAILVAPSGQGIRTQLKPMDPAKKILYNIPLDLNKITAEELELIPGIGPGLAENIVRYRQGRGSFTRLDELLNISGIGTKKLRSLRRYLSVGGNSPASP